MTLGFLSKKTEPKMETVIETVTETKKESKTETKILNNFPLADLENTFRYASFQRDIKKLHVKEIKEAIRKGNFYDNIIRVMKSDNNSYELIDGQHRIEALRGLRDDEVDPYTHFDLVLHIFSEGDPRNIYRRLNLGRGLVLWEHLKAMDNEDNSFFTELRECCEHGLNPPNKISFVQAVNCIHYAKTGNSHTIKAISVDDFITRVVENDFVKTRLIYKIMRKTIPDKKSGLYGVNIFRNIYRISFENDLSSEKIKILIDLIVKDHEKIQEIIDASRRGTLTKVYHHITDILGPENNLSLKQFTSVDKL